MKELIPKDFIILFVALGTMGLAYVLDQVGLYILSQPLALCGFGSFILFVILFCHKIFKDSRHEELNRNG